MNLLLNYKRTLDELSSLKFVNAVIIFGSYASAKIKPLSDLDVAVIFKEGTSEKLKDTVLAYGADTLDISKFEDLPILLKKKILEEGKPYYSCIDLKVLLRWVRHEWWEFRPFLVRLYKKRGYRVELLEK